MSKSKENNKKKPVVKKKSATTAVKKAETKAPVPKKVTIKKAVVKETKASSTVSTNDKKQKDTLKVGENFTYATGRRKESTAKVWIFKGSGLVRVNHLDPLDYLGSPRLVDQLLFPLNILNIKGYDIRIDVIGGGLNGQAQASKLGISRAILELNEDYRSTLREHGCLTQDRREKERKKYGKRGARKSPQFRKR